MRLSLLEIFLLQLVVYSAIWLWDEFVASYLCIVLPGVLLAILIIATLAELIEPSRISRKYFAIMGISIVTPILVGIAYYLIYDGQLEWFDNLYQ